MLAYKIYYSIESNLVLLNNLIILLKFWTLSRLKEITEHILRASNVCTLSFCRLSAFSSGSLLSHLRLLILTHSILGIARGQQKTPECLTGQYHGGIV